ncbi:MAG TPA: hypothetical protein VF403_10595 [Kofleriaceae bacterium]
MTLKWIVVVLAAGCEKDLLAELPDAATVATMNVHGTAAINYSTDSGDMVVPVDLTTAAIETFAPDGSEERVPTSKIVGDFDIPVDANAARWDLCYTQFGGTPVCVLGAAPMPLFENRLIGRPDQHAPTMPTPVTFNATNLLPWQTTDDLELFSTSVGAFVGSPEQQFVTPLATDAVAIAGQTFDWATSATPLVDASKGDTVTVMQQRAQLSGSDSYLGVARAGTATDFRQVDGQPSTLSVALADLPQHQVTLHWKRSQFEPLQPLGSTDGQQFLYVDALPELTTYGVGTGSPDLALYNPPVGSTDIDDTLSYGNPFSTNGTSWDEFVALSYFFNISRLAPGATTPLTNTTGYFERIPVALLGTGVLAPKITAVRGVTLAGADAMMEQHGTGLTPTVAWNAPAMGTPTFYRVDIYELGAVAGVSQFTLRGSIYGTETSIVIPPHILAAGTTYILEITAVIQPNKDIAAAPFSAHGQVAEFAIATAQFTP